MKRSLTDRKERPFSRLHKAWMGILCPLVFLSWAQGAPSDSFTVTITLQDTFPPAAVTDLVAVPGSPGQVLLTWTSPDEDGAVPTGLPVTSYTVRYATFSALSVGSTTTWWNGATNATGEPPPLPVGSPQSLLLSDLTPGTVYYFSIKSVDDMGNLSPIDIKSVPPELQAQALVAGNSSRPAAVTGFTVSTNPDGSLVVNWAPVQLYEDKTPATDIIGYRMYRNSDPLGPFTALASSTTFTSLSEPASPSDVYYQIVAVRQSGKESNPACSNLLHVAPTGFVGLVSMATDGSLTRATVPPPLMPELKNSLLRVSRNNDPKLNMDKQNTLATYTINLKDPTSCTDEGGNPITFTQPAINVLIAFVPPPSENGAPVTQKQVGVLWWNGIKWIKLGRKELDAISNTVTFKTALSGTYQARWYQAATSLTLDKSAVFPKLFSPNGDDVNDVVYFVLENPQQSEVQGKIMDVTGGSVADLRPAGTLTPDTLLWDGKDKSGNPVPAGVYLYQIKGEGKTLNGTVVVVK